MSWLISFALAYSSCEEHKRELQNEHFLLQVKFEPPTFRLRSDRDNHSVMKHYQHVSYLPLPIPRGKCSGQSLFILLTLYSQQKSILVKMQNDTNVIIWL